MFFISSIAFLLTNYSPVVHEICVWNMISSVFIVALNGQSLLTANLVFKILDPGIEPVSPASPALQVDTFTAEPLRKPV